jgi:hypothetical protein
LEKTLLLTRSKIGSGPEQPARGRAVTVAAVVGFMLITFSLVEAQSPISAQVLVTMVKDQLFAITPTEGFVKEDLIAGEEVVSTSSAGLNALVQTSTRLLGFSSQSMRWSEQRLDLYERVQDSRVLPRLLVVRTNKRLYGFQGSVGQWQSVDLQVQEEVRDTLAAENVAAVVTDKRVLGFSGFTGGFFLQDLPIGESLLAAVANDNLVLVTMSSRRLVFQSQRTAWVEMR